jgi:hypothetical protein
LGGNKGAALTQNVIGLVVALALVGPVHAQQSKPPATRDASNMQSLSTGTGTPRITVQIPDNFAVEPGRNERGTGFVAHLKGQSLPELAVLVQSTNKIEERNSAYWSQMASGLAKQFFVEGYNSSGPEFEKTLKIAGRIGYSFLGTTSNPQRNVTGARFILFKIDGSHIGIVLMLGDLRRADVQALLEVVEKARIVD